MRRLWCFLLLAAFGMPFLAPLLANAQGVESLLPACCRRAGKHHCAMTSMPGAASATDDQAPRWTAVPAKCPCCPELVRTFAHHEVAVAAAAAQPVIYFDFARPLGRAQTESRWRISRERSRHKRGPPSSSLA